MKSSNRQHVSCQTTSAVESRARANNKRTRSKDGKEDEDVEMDVWSNNKTPETNIL